MYVIKCCVVKWRREDLEDSVGLSREMIAGAIAGKRYL
jgi:hypothetical protein